MADRADLVIIGGGPGGYAAALYGAAAGLDIAMIEKEKVGGTCLHRGCIPAKELLETAAVLPHVGRRGRVRRHGRRADDRLRRDARPASRRSSTSSTRACRSLLKSRKVTVLDGTGACSAPARGHGHGGEDGDLELDGRRRASWPPAPCPRTIPGFDVDGDLVVTSDELLSHRRAAGLGRGHRRRRHRVRVRVDDEPTSAPRSPSSRRCPRSSRACDDDVGQGRRALVQEARASTSTPAWRSPATTPGGGGHHRAVRRGRVHRGRRGRRVRRPPPAVRRPRPRRHRGGGRRAGLRRGRRAAAAPASRASTPSATSSPRPAWPTSASPRRIVVDQGHPRRGPRAGRLRQGAVVHLLPSRGRVRRALRGGGQGGGLRRRHRRSTASAATAGR